MPIRLVLADDHPLILNGLMGLLTSREDFEVLATCTNGEDALKAVLELKPDILVLDIRMADMNGISVLSELCELGSPVKVVFLTAEISEDEAAKSLRLGVMGIVLKEMAPQMLLTCLRKVHGGARWVERGSFYQAVEVTLNREKNLEQLQQTLTNREVELVKMVGRGLRNKEIANKLFITEATVKTHIFHIFRKLNLESRTQLACYAQAKKLLFD